MEKKEKENETIPGNRCASNSVTAEDIALHVIQFMYAYLIQSVDTWAESSVYTEDLVIDDG